MFMAKTNIEPKRILIVQTAFLGDVVLTLPLVQKIHEKFLNAEIDFMAIPAAQNLLSTIPQINHLWIYDKHDQEKGLAAFINYTRNLREKYYQIAFVPHCSMRSAALIWLAKIPTRIGFNRSAGKWLFTDVIPYPIGVHEINRNLHLLKRYGVDPTVKVIPRLYFSEKDKQTVQEFLKEHSLNAGRRFITIAPGSVWATKRWLPEYFAKLADMLGEIRYQIVLIGDESDKPIARAIAESTKLSIYSAVGKFSVRQSALLIRSSRLLITNDSAPMHLAVAGRTPVVAIFGPTVREFGFYPYGECDRIAELKNLICRPCGKHGGAKCPIGTFECMKNLLPKHVFQQVKCVLDQTT